MSLNKRLINTGGGGLPVFGVGQAVIASSTDGVYYSWDYGDNWIQSVSSTSVGKVAVDNTGYTMVYSDNSGYFISTDAGQNWSFMLSDGGSLDAVSISDSGQKIVCQSVGNTRYSTDGGATFGYSSGLPASESTNFYSHRNIAGTQVWANVNNGSTNNLYVSNDSGATWTFNRNLGGDGLFGKIMESLYDVFWGYSSSIMFNVSSNSITGYGQSSPCGSITIKDWACDNISNYNIWLLGKASGDTGNYRLVRNRPGRTQWDYCYSTSVTDANCIEVLGGNKTLVGLNGGTIMKTSTNNGTFSATNAPSKTWKDIESNKIRT